MIDIEKYSVEQILQGYLFDLDKNAYVCLSCGQVFLKGEVFCIENRFFDAHIAVQNHIQTHEDRFLEMLDTNDRYLSLTENQKEILKYIHDGLTDAQIAAKLNVALATVRNQRFIFREKAKAAKMYLAVWSLAKKNADPCNQNSIISLKKGEKMVDERFVITQQENDQITKTIFLSLEPLRLKLFPVKEKKKIVILRRIIQEFEQDKKYSEKEINEKLKAIYPDYATIRRYLIEYGYMNRTNDCNEYWVN